jgi:hypothetical protein
MSRPISPRLSNIDEFPASYPDQNSGRMSSEAFAAALLGHRDPAVGAEFSETILREYDPDQPRDEQGRWTSDDSSDGASSEKNSKKKREPKELDRMVVALTKTDEGKKLYASAKKSAKALGADDLTIKLDKRENLPNGDAAMNPRTGTVGIPDDASDAAMLEDMLVELSNMAKAKDFADLQSTGIKKLSRDEYIEAMEKPEFESLQNAARLWKAVAKACGQDPSRMPTYKNPDEVLKMDFKTHFSQVAKSQKDEYGRQWDRANARQR